MAEATEQQIAAASAWLDQHAAASQQITTAAAAQGAALWAGFTAWYSAAAVAAVAAQAARLSQASQQTIVGAAQAYIANVVAALRDTRTVSIPRTPDLPAVRGESAPAELVHTRPAEAYRKAFATGSTHEEALNIALGRAEALQVGDLTLAERVASQVVMEQLGVTQFRRVVRPELSKTGSCGLCIAASDRIYETAVLMPMHGNCHCKTMPIIDGIDPGNSLNGRDLEAFYADAGGSNTASELKKTRYVVNEHGEYGPVLSRDGQAFRGPKKVRLEDDPERAARMLTQVIPVLERLERDGGPEAALAYQRDLAARLVSIAA